MENWHRRVPLLRSCIAFSVPEHGVCVHADLQPDLHDAAGGPLVRLSPVPRAHAAGLPQEQLGGNQ